MDDSLKISLQNLAAVTKGRKTVSKGVENQKIILPSHSSIVHLHHEYRMQFLLSHFEQQLTEMKVTARSAPTGLVAESLRRHSLATCIICLLVGPQVQFGTVQLVPLGKGMERNFAWVCDIVYQVSICICFTTLLLPVSSCLCLSCSLLGMLHGWCQNSRKFLKSLQPFHHLYGWMGFEGNWILHCG